jgi:hypothetical protein
VRDRGSGHGPALFSAGKRAELASREQILRWRPFNEW